MITHEGIIFDIISTEVRENVPNAYVIGVELTDTPSQFPAVSITLTNNETNKRYSTFESVENCVSEEYKVEICSNLVEPREAKEQTYEMLEIIDSIMYGLHFPRTFCQTIPSADRKITRLVARYKRDNLTQEDL